MEEEEVDARQQQQQQQHTHELQWLLRAAAVLQSESIQLLSLLPIMEACKRRDTLGDTGWLTEEEDGKGADRCLNLSPEADEINPSSKAKMETERCREMVAVSSCMTGWSFNSVRSDPSFYFGEDFILGQSRCTVQSNRRNQSAPTWGPVRGAEHRGRFVGLRGRADLSPEATSKRPGMGVKGYGGAGQASTAAASLCFGSQGTGAGVQV
ncbi:hypothetical protein Q5P01_021665 [Channa striata]|uniref:Uncharacterized protein n=1 Tax=Channa striata TaxID=64152 RepID=A0AA88LUN0_CHASR|nr:hypothetical protein Q5P01_021665 [Channa striata]